MDKIGEILNAAVAYAAAKVEESHALKSGTSDQYDAAVKRSDALYEQLREQTAASVAA